MDAVMDLNPYFAILDKPYREYTSTIMDAGTASSLKVCAYLCHLMVTQVPDRGVILDMGAGVTAMALRIAKKHYKLHRTIKSVALTDEWVYHTKDFCDRWNVSSAGFGIYGKMKLPKADLIFYKLGASNQRATYLDEVVGLLKDGGYMMVDDFHKATVRNAFENLPQDFSSVPGVWRDTLDPRKRYGVLLEVQALADDDAPDPEPENNG